MTVAAEDLTPKSHCGPPEDSYLGEPKCPAGQIRDGHCPNESFILKAMSLNCQKGKRIAMEASNGYGADDLKVFEL